MGEPAEPFIDYDDDPECWNCGGEGYVYGCSWDWQCDTWDGDSCLCTRPCHICHPRKDDPAMRKLMGEMLATNKEACRKPGCTKARGTICEHSLCHGRGYGQHLYGKAAALPSHKGAE